MKALVLFDGQCPFCRKSVALLKRLDWLRRFDTHDCRDPEGIPINSANIDPAALLDQMHLLTPDRTRTLAGFRAVRYVIGRLPIGWPIWPFLFLPGMTTLGQRVYLWVAKHRFHLVPCHDGVCELPAKK